MANADNIAFKTSMDFTYGKPSPMGPGIVRLVANNPSAFTFKGTNTYLVGMTSLAVIDPGPDDAAHIEHIVKCAAGRPITHIVVTHAHRDHVDGAARLAGATGATTCGFGRSGSVPAFPAASPSGKSFVNYEFSPDIKLRGGDVVVGDDWSLECLHTPGHAPDHLCFALKGRRVVFSGDHVMAWNTSVIAPPEGSMADYMASLELLLERNDQVFLPGHGGRIDEPQRTVKAYLLHRRWREQAVLAAIRGGANTVNLIVPEVYPNISGTLGLAAALSVQAHVEYLIERGVVAAAATSWDSPLSLLSPSP
jgi:glyoxylase-like metal-dependent hydrolase (beta-lactamase superfamily II)